MNHSDYFQYTRIQESLVLFSGNSPVRIVQSNPYRVYLQVQMIYDSGTVGGIPRFATNPTILQQMQALALTTGNTWLVSPLQNGMSFTINGSIVCSEFWAMRLVAGSDCYFLVTESIMDSNPCEDSMSHNPYPDQDIVPTRQQFTGIDLPDRIRSLEQELRSGFILP